MKSVDINPGRVEWDRYVTGCRFNSFTHLYGWGESLACTYDLPLFRLAARREGEHGKITGILPLLLFRAPDRPPRLISLPYCDSCGILADDPESSSLLATAALKLAKRHHAEHLEYRHTAAANHYLGKTLTKHSACRAHSFKIGLSRTLPDTAEDLWDDLSAKVRNQIRKATKNDCRAVVGESELLDDFFTVFSENMRDLGSPVHSRSLFSEVAAQLVGTCKTVIILHQKTPVAAAMVFRCGETLFNPWASSLRKYRPVCPNMLLYWTMLEYGCNSGCSTFDFGRSSPQATTCRFKLQWGGLPSPLTWHVLSLTAPAWDPQKEHLQYESIRKLTLGEALHSGPKMRRWISL